MPRDLFSQPRDLLGDTSTKGTEELSVQDALHSGMEFLNQRDPGIDYNTGVRDAGLRGGFSRMSGETEKANYLDQTIGKGLWGKDHFGAYFILPQGLKKLGIKSDKTISFDEQKVTGYDIVDWVGSAPAIVGGTGMAMTASGVGALPGMGLTALGSAGGKAIDEIIKNFQGYRKQSAPEIATDLAGEGALAAAGEGVFRLGGGLLSGYSPFIDPARKALTQEALNMGARPKTYQTLGSAGPLLQRFQATGERVLGDPAQSINRQALTKGAEELQRRAGIPAADTGSQIVTGARATAEQGPAYVKYFDQKANEMLGKHLQDVRTVLGSSDANIGNTVIAKIKGARKAFSTLAEERYAGVDASAGKPIIPTAALKAQAERISKQLPRTADGKVIFSKGEVNPIQDILNMPEYVTVQQMQRVRTALRESSDFTNMVPGVDKHDIGLLKDAAEKSFDSVASSDAQTIKNLREADTFYKEGIKKFDSPAIAAITRDASKTGSVEPDRVLDYIIKPGYTASALRVKALVGADVWKKVSRAHFDEAIAKARPASDLEGMANGAILYQNFQKMGKTFDVVYGKDAPKVMAYARSLAAKNGKIDPKSLGGDVAFTDALESAVTKQASLDKFLSDNYLSQLAKPGTEADQAIDFIFRKDSPQRISKAREFFGEGSREWKNIQGKSMERVLSNFVQSTDDPIIKVLDGKALRASLDSYGRNTLNEVFGKDLAADLYKFSDVAQLVTKKGPIGAGGIVAANIALHPISRFGTIADLFLMGRFLRTPGAIKWLTLGIRADTPTKQRAAALARVTAITTSLAKDQTGSATFTLTEQE